MDPDRYYRSITRELLAVYDRVENAIDAQHQGEIGSWRESLVRGLIRRHLPATMAVGQGFILTNDGPTKQLDVIVYDMNYPNIVQEGELIIVTPDAVRAIVEVKSTTSGNQLRRDLQALAQVSLACRADARVRTERSMQGSGLFVGYFAFQRPREILGQTLTAAFRESVLWTPQPLKPKSNQPEAVRAAEHERQIPRLRGLRSSLLSQPFLATVDAAALGPDQFVRHWHALDANSPGGGNQWRSYILEELSFGYFLTNLLASVVPSSIRQHHALWWPEDPKRNGVAIQYPLAEDLDPHWEPSRRDQGTT